MQVPCVCFAGGFAFGVNDLKGVAFSIDCGLASFVNFPKAFAFVINWDWIAEFGSSTLVGEVAFCVNFLNGAFTIDFGFGLGVDFPKAVSFAIVPVGLAKPCFGVLGGLFAVCVNFLKALSFTIDVEFP